MFLYGERPWVQLDAENHNSGHESGPKSAHRIRHQLGDELVTPGLLVNTTWPIMGRTPPTVTVGYRKKKIWLTPDNKMAQNKPIIHARRVFTSSCDEYFWGKGVRRTYQAFPGRQNSPRRIEPLGMVILRG